MYGMVRAIQSPFLCACSIVSCLHLTFEAGRPSGCSSRRHMFGSALFPDCTSDLSISAGRRAGAPGPAEKPTRSHKLDRLNRRISWPWWYSYSARPGLGVRACMPLLVCPQQAVQAGPRATVCSSENPKDHGAAAIVTVQRAGGRSSAGR